MNSEQVSLPGFSELPGFLDALVDAESVLHNSDSECEFLNSSSSCIPYDSLDYHPISSASAAVSSLYNSCQQAAANSYHLPSSSHTAIVTSASQSIQGPIFMEDTASNSSSTGADSAQLNQSPHCFLLESPSFQGSVSLDGATASAVAVAGANQDSNMATALPSFQETYSPRYRRDVFSFDESAVSPFQHQVVSPSGINSTGPPPPPPPPQSMTHFHHPQHQQQQPQQQNTQQQQQPEQNSSPVTTMSYQQHHQLFYPPSASSSPPTFDPIPPSPPMQTQGLGRVRKIPELTR